MNRCLQSTAMMVVGSMLLGAAAPTTAPLDLAPTLAPLAAQYNIPGLVGAILRGDGIVAQGSVGVRKVGDPAPFQPTDIIHLGSDTKAMTAFLIGQLIDKKQLAFDTTLRQAFPDFALKMNPDMAGVSVRNLLDHDGGLPHDLPWNLIAATHQPLTAQRQAAVEIALSVKPATPIGQYAYSNVGYVLLGAIIERKNGLPWEQVIQRDLFDPLHMPTAGFGPPGTSGKVDQPWGHILNSGKLEPNQIDNPPVIGPAGAVHCSIGDWSKFIAEVLHSAQGHPTLLSLDTFRELTKPMPGQSYAGGWIVTRRPWAGGLALAHAGSNTMWYCDAWIAPEKDFAILIAANDGDATMGNAIDRGVGLLIGMNERIKAAR